MNETISLSDKQVDSISEFIRFNVRLEVPDQTLLDKIDIAFDQICPKKSSKTMYEYKNNQDILSFMVGGNKICIYISPYPVTFEELLEN